VMNSWIIITLSSTGRQLYRSSKTVLRLTVNDTDIYDAIVAKAALFVESQTNWRQPTEWKTVSKLLRLKRRLFSLVNEAFKSNLLKNLSQDFTKCTSPRCNRQF